MWTPSWPLCHWDWNNLKGGFWLHFSCPNIWVGMDSSSGHREHSWLCELINLLCPIIENHPEGLKGVCVFCDFSIQATNKQIEILVTSPWKEPRRYTLLSCPLQAIGLLNPEKRQVYFFVTKHCCAHSLQPLGSWWQASSHTAALGDHWGHPSL